MAYLTGDTLVAEVGRVVKNLRVVIADYDDGSADTFVIWLGEIDESICDEDGFGITEAEVVEIDNPLLDGLVPHLQSLDDLIQEDAGPWVLLADLAAEVWRAAKSRR